jgi:hypothetical protein
MLVTGEKEVLSPSHLSWLKFEEVEGGESSKNAEKNMYRIKRKIMKEEGAGFS